MYALRAAARLPALAGAAIALPALLCLTAPPAFAVGSALPPAPSAWVTDGAGFLSGSAREALNARLRESEARFGHQVLVWIGPTTAGAPIEDWAARAFAAWKVGRRGLDDGVVLFILRDDRKIRIEVGYGLEEKLTDARASSIIREVMAPHLQRDDRDGAVRAGVDAILATVTGTVGNTEGAGSFEPAARRQLGWLEFVVVALLGIGLVWFVVTNPGLAILLLTTLASGRGGGRGGGFGGGGGGGGGFSGGGGRSGGGGATGSW